MHLSCLRHQVWIRCVPSRLNTSDNSPNLAALSEQLPIGARSLVEKRQKRPRQASGSTQWAQYEPLRRVEACQKSDAPISQVEGQHQDGAEQAFDVGDVGRRQRRPQHRPPQTGEFAGEGAAALILGQIHALGHAFARICPVTPPGDLTSGNRRHDGVRINAKSRQ
eukprot:TRINITY_DN36375_c0_g1_i1.p1 TRINITY_DN36375_c0_g1~~TRINITY_DN36375_c0_g1_i1.p1  ORF type:complete len:166 (-),score=16.20 TRINITY_DN36375_c0_g1_i1:112-609(-)